MTPVSPLHLLSILPWIRGAPGRGSSRSLSSQSQVALGFRSLSGKWSAELATRTLLTPSHIIAPNPRRSEDISHQFSNVDEMLDSGSKKELGPEVAPEKALNFEDPDTKSIEMTSGVEKSSKEAENIEPLSPDTVLVVV